MQVLIYTPWLIVFIRQMMGVGGGFWITIQFPQILIDIINFQFKGNLQETVPTIFAILLAIYIAYIIIKNIRNKEDIKNRNNTISNICNCNNSDGNILNNISNSIS